MYNNEYFQNMSMENNIGPSMNQPMPMGEAMGQPVQQRVINRTFVHEVPQDCSFMIEK